MLLSDEILRAAKARIEDEVNRSEGNLRRAVSDLYYSAFHAVCEAFLEPVSGDIESDAYKGHYRELYRQLDHGYAERQCKDISQDQSYSEQVRNFARNFASLKNKRVLADYDPLERFSISATRNDYAKTKRVLQEFKTATLDQRARFARRVTLQFPKGYKRRK